MLRAENISNLGNCGKQWAEFPACQATHLHLLLSFCLTWRAHGSGAGSHQPALNWPLSHGLGTGGHRPHGCGWGTQAGRAGIGFLLLVHTALAARRTLDHGWSLRNVLGHAGIQSSGDAESSKWEITGYHLDEGNGGQFQRGQGKQAVQWHTKSSFNKCKTIYFKGNIQTTCVHCWVLN